MVRQDELAFIKALSALHMKLATKWRKKVPTVSAGRRSTTTGSRSRASQQLAGKRKANELASSGDSSTGAQQLELGPCLYPRQLESRANKLLPAAGKPNHPG